MDSAESQRNLIEQLAEEFMRRRRRGEIPTIEEYAQRYPERADEIRGLFPALEMMEIVRDDVTRHPSAKEWTAPASHIGERLGDYRILREIGRGGMGSVYEADQESLGRRVALKVLSPELARSWKYLERFQREARAAANLQHTNIVPVIGVGQDRGVYYYVMQYIHGRGMDEIMSALHRELPVRGPSELDDETSAAGLAVALETGQAAASSAPGTSALGGNTIGETGRLSGGSTSRSTGSSRNTYFHRIAEIGAQVADALDYAHRRGVLHRDIKPSNLLFDVTGNVWVTDFGLAKIEGEKDLTATGDVVGTLRYIAPESFRGQFDARGDIYGLGLTLYELAARRTAFGGSDHGELVRQISQEGPPRLSRHSGVPRDLETIIHKAIERDPKDRYSCAENVAADLRRFLRHEPVLARRISPPARLMRWAGRNRALAAVSALLLTGLVLGFVASLVVSARLISLTDDLTRSLRVSRHQNYVGDIGLAYEAVQKGNLGRAQTLLGKHRAESGEEDLRGFEWRYLWAPSQGNYVADLGRYIGFLSGVAISPDGQFVALNRSDPWRVEAIHLASGTVTKSIEVPAEVDPLIFSPSGDLLVGRGRHQGNVVGWDTRSWKAREPLPIKFPLAFGHDAEDEIFVARDGDHLSIWDATDWQKIGDLANAPGAGRLLEPAFGDEGHMNDALEFSHDDRFVYLAARERIRRWDLDRRIELPSFAADRIMCLATCGEGQLAAADRWGKVHLIHPETGQILHTFPSHTGWMTGLRSARNGTRLFSVSSDRKVVVYDTVKRSIIDRLLGHQTEPWGLDVSADGRTVVSGAGHGGHVLTWSLSEADGSALNLDEVERSAVLSDNRILIYRKSSEDLEYYDPIQESLEPAQAKRFVEALQDGERNFVSSFSPNAKWILSRDGNALVVWDILAGKQERVLLHTCAPISRALFSPDGRLLVTAEVGSDVRLWRTDSWTSEVLCQRTPMVRGIGFSGDSRRVAIAGLDAFIRVFDLSGGSRQVLLENEEDDPIFYSVALSVSGRWLAAGEERNAVRVWDLETQQRIAKLEGHTVGVFSVSFSPDDRTLASSTLGSLKLWNVTTWQELMSFDDDRCGVQFSADGRYLAGMRSRAGTELNRGLGPGLRILKPPTLQEIDANLSGHAQRNGTR